MNMSQADPLNTITRVAIVGEQHLVEKFLVKKFISTGNQDSLEEAIRWKYGYIQFNTSDGLCELTCITYFTKGYNFSNRLYNTQEDLLKEIKRVMLNLGFKEKIDRKKNQELISIQDDVVDYSGKEQEKEIEKVIRYSVEAGEFKVLSYDYDQFERKFRVVFLGDFWSGVDDKASLQEFTNEKTEENEILECIKLTYTKDTFEVYNGQLKITLDGELHIK